MKEFNSKYNQNKNIQGLKMVMTEKLRGGGQKPEALIDDDRFVYFQKAVKG